jgi:hypothetical protein
LTHHSGSSGILAFPGIGGIVPRPNPPEERFSGPHRQSFLPTQPIDPLGIDLPAFSSQKRGQPSIPESDPDPRHFPSIAIAKPFDLWPDFDTESSIAESGSARRRHERRILQVARPHQKGGRSVQKRDHRRTLRFRGRVGTHRTVGAPVINWCLDQSKILRNNGLTLKFGATRSS